MLAHAVDTATVEGLDGLTIGRLAEASGHSKSGIATLFGSKEQLQLAVVEFAGQQILLSVSRGQVTRLADNSQGDFHVG